MDDRLDTVRRWTQFILVLVSFVIATVMYMTGKTTTPPPLPPVIPQASPVVVVLGQSGSSPSAVEAVQASALRHPVRDRLRAKLVEAAVAKGATAEQANEALSTLESERPLLDWLFKGGFLELLKLIMEIINALK